MNDITHESSRLETYECLLIYSVLGFVRLCFSLLYLVNQVNNDVWR